MIFSPLSKAVWERRTRPLRGLFDKRMIDAGLLRPPSKRLPSIEGPGLSASIDLYWLPLGAGGRFVRFNGRAYELIHALVERRRPLDLYHSALEITLPKGRFVIENAWPIPDGAGASRGCAVEGPVGSRRLARFRAFRYEIRRWPNGLIADVAEAVDGPQRLSDDQAKALRLLELVGTVPPLLWGRDELDLGEMWNSNSVISWLLARTGMRPEEISPPMGGRAPGWDAGIRLAHLSETREPLAPQQQSESSVLPTAL
ncbi:MAG: hypothetical protein QOH48_2253 [Actinomycetota bacterium]|jgi:hypothetical protein|nr:hypothetical protein [Actinomycetota bacterium]